MTRPNDDRFQVWKERAEEISLLAAAQMFGAKLKKHGAEWIGPCCFCGGNDRFGINLGKGKWHCRGHGGGASTIALAMHLGNLAFKEAIEQLTGEPPPNGPARPLSPEQQAARNRQRIDSERIQEQRRAEEERYQEQTTAAALAIWEGSTAISGTLAEKYLNSRGIPTPDEWPGVVRFHSGLPYPGKSGLHPAMVCRVDGCDGQLTAIWRTFLRADARKMDCANPKLGLGPAGGGAIRLGGVASKVGLAEGFESGYAAWLLTGQKFPVWPCLSTSGLVGIELPLCVERTVLFPDGDSPVRKKGHDYEPAIPAGRKAAEALRARLLSESVACSIAAEPGPGLDMLDIWNASQRETA